MKRMIASAGLLALGAASMHAAGYAPGYASTDNSQPWSVSATLRGFYDDNYNTAPNNPAPGQTGPQSSWGISITPTVSAALSTDQTELGARFTFIGNWYADRPDSQWDDSFIFDFYIGHTFSPRVNMFISEQAVYSQEPDIIAPISAGGQPFRTDNNNFRNSGSITLNTQMTELMTLVLGYSNTYYDYQQQGAFSYSALLDRIENTGLVNLRYQFTPTTTGLIGANFGLVDYTGNQIIAVSTNGVPLYSDSRNQNQFTVYAGVDHSFTPDFSASIQAGAQYVNVYNATPDYTQWAPYADMSIQYQYGAGCYIRGGFRQFYDQTYVLAANSSASVVYASVNHAFTPKLTGGILGTFQYSEYNSPNGAVQQYGAINGTSANFFELGLNLTYQFDRHFSANAAYLLDLNDSSTPAVYSYTRNRFYFGVGATY